jgi:hypothetical protein
LLVQLWRRVDAEVKIRPVARPGLEPYFPPMQLDDPFRPGEAHSAAASELTLSMEPSKYVEHPLRAMGLYADSIVANTNNSLISGSLWRLRDDADLNSFFRLIVILYGVQD